MSAFRVTYSFSHGKYFVHAAGCQAAKPGKHHASWDAEQTTVDAVVEGCTRMEAEKDSCGPEDMTPERLAKVRKDWVRVCKCARAGA